MTIISYKLQVYYWKKINSGMKLPRVAVNRWLVMNAAISFITSILSNYCILTDNMNIVFLISHQRIRFNLNIFITKSSLPMKDTFKNKNNHWSLFQSLHSGVFFSLLINVIWSYKYNKKSSVKPKYREKRMFLSYPSLFWIISI